jgi:hypothetical protein
VLLSGSSNTIGTGSKTFTVNLDADNSMYRVGNFVNVGAAPGNFMFGQITSFSGSSITVNVTFTVGSGTYSGWSFSLSASPGATGPAGASGATGPEPGVGKIIAISMIFG